MVRDRVFYVRANDAEYELVKEAAALSGSAPGPWSRSTLVTMAQHVILHAKYKASETKGEP